jgi:predicted DNA-binding transcriptional regulator AlpA
MTTTLSGEIGSSERGADFLDIDAVRVFFGGTKPINRSTVWRKIKLGTIPKPIPGLQRWLRHECEAAKQAFIAQRA